MATPGTSLKPAEQVRTAPVLALGLVGGYLTARESGIRPLGGLVLVAAGALALRTALVRRGPAVAVGLGALYVGGFGASHPLAKTLGAWPSVLAVTAVNVVAAHLLVDAPDDVARPRAASAAPARIR
ncbi:hypothetical protein [Auraticoccus monumenti]|uniref:Uncharacterized protein n=1 Tax=Auraticoccus monumenti TaxID=675864 RepID=A0A1G6ZRP7_9ACTN|nr:hypothetical protein [Auraticoccus monumenti]SDE04515.1 hypothetical protein SAMN04489747_2360 [Auraticoccus monumenti]